jgi:hypothetical protein
MLIYINYSNMVEGKKPADQLDFQQMTEAEREIAVSNQVEMLRREKLLPLVRAQFGEPDLISKEDMEILASRSGKTREAGGLLKRLNVREIDGQKIIFIKDPDTDRDELIMVDENDFGVVVEEWDSVVGRGLEN